MFYSREDIVKESKTDTVYFRLLHNGIVHVSYIEHAEIGRQQQIINIDVFTAMVGNDIKRPLLIEGGEFASFTKEGLDTVKELELEAPILARAFVTKSLAQILYINFFKRLTSPIPMKTFENHDEAVQWLLKMKQNN